MRINTKDPNNKNILVDLTSVTPKGQLILKYKDYNNSNKTSKFSTETLHIKVPRKPVFISENLTRKMKYLSLKRTSTPHKTVWKTLTLLMTL